MLGELKLGAKSRDGSKASLLVRGGLSEEIVTTTLPMDHFREIEFVSG